MASKESIQKYLHDLPQKLGLTFLRVFFLIVVLSLVSKGATSVSDAINNIVEDFWYDWQSAPGKVWSRLALEAFTNAGHSYWSCIKEQPEPLMRITMVVKGLLVIGMFGMAGYIILSPNVFREKGWGLALVPFKIVTVFLFMSYGMAQVLQQFNPYLFFEFGEMFSFRAFMLDFLENKLAILLLTFIVMRDILSIKN